MVCKQLINDFLVTAYPQGLPNYKEGEAFRNKVSIDLRVVGSVVFSSVDVVAAEEKTKINLLMFIKPPF